MISLEETRELLNEASSERLRDKEVEPAQLQGQEAESEQLRDEEVVALRDSCAALARIFVDTVLEELGANPEAN